MLFNSLVFVLVFLPIVYLGFAVASRHGAGAACVWLVMASAVFYGWWSVGFLVLLILLAAANYLLGAQLGPERPQWVRAASLSAGIALDLGVLAYFKYADFLVSSVDPGLAKDWQLERIALPLAISFFTFQKIAYLVDVYRGEAKPGSFLHYLFFVSFFPQLIAGPIVHWREIAPQIPGLGVRRDRSHDLAVGLSIFFAGLFKKVCIADTVSPIADGVFGLAASGGTPSFGEAWAGALAFTLQIYFDFSGYTDMAIGLARMFGMRLPENFDSPYKARDMVEFWRRWHMTLSTFLRDYLYKPLGGNRSGTARRIANVAIVMLLGGLWHGAAWTFVAWGGLHATYIAATHAYRARFGWSTARGAVLVETAVTFVAVVVAWVLFRAESFDAAFRIFAGMADPASAALPGRLAEALHGMFPSLNFGLAGLFPNLTPIGRAPDLTALGVMMAGLLVCLLAPNRRQIVEGAGWPVWRPTRLWALAMGLAGTASLLLVSRSGQFIYFQF